MENRKKYLIINLKRNGDIFNMAHTIQAIKNDDNDASIQLVVLKEFEKAAQALSGIDHIYTLDRQKILTFKKNNIFSDGMALNHFEEEINQFAIKKWDFVFNYSNDRVSTHISSYLSKNTSKHIGIRFNETCNIEYSNEWALLFNDIISDLNFSPLSFRDNYNWMANVKSGKMEMPLKTKEEYNKTAHLNFSEIRRIESGEGEVKIIGIQVSASHQYKTIPYSEIIALIDEMYMTPDIFPILLGAPTDSDRTLISKINGEFNNSLVSIEADFHALSSVMLNLDALITPDTSIKHVADLLEIPTVELSLGESPLFKQGTVNTKSVIITPSVKNRSFKKKEVESTREYKDLNNLIKGSDIMTAIYYVLGERDSFEKATLSTGLSVYQPVNDELGTRLTLIAGERVDAIETDRLITRSLICKKLINKEDTGIYDEVSTFSSKFVTEWINTQRDIITETSKDLLGTLRAIIQIDSNEKSVRSFLGNLTKLCAYCDSPWQFAKLPSLRFRARLEALNTSNIQASAKEVEGLLYEYKADIQHQVDVLKSLQHVLRERTQTSSKSATKVNYNEPRAGRI